MIHLAYNLRHLRQQGNKTGRQMCILIPGISKKAYHAWEIGKNKPRLAHLIAIAEFWNITLDDLILKDLRKL